MQKHREAAFRERFFDYMECTENRRRFAILRGGPLSAACIPLFERKRNMRVERLDHLVLTVEDMDATIRFYCDVQALQQEIPS